MASSILDAQRLREILHYDADTGLFTWKVESADGAAVLRGACAAVPNCARFGSASIE